MLTVILVAEVAESVAFLMITGRAGSSQFTGWLLGIGTLAKWLALAVLVLLAAALAFQAQVIRKHVNGQTMTAVKQLRWQVGIALVLTALLTGVSTDQIQDALLAIADSPARAVSSGVAVVLLSLTMWASVHRAAGTEREKSDPIRPWVILSACVLAGIAGIWWRNLWGLAIVLAALVALSWLAGVPPWRSDNPDSDSSTARQKLDVTVWAARFAVFPCVVTALFIIRSSAVPAVLAKELLSRPVVLFAVGLGAAFLPIVLLSLLRPSAAARRDDTPSGTDDRRRINWAYGFAAVTGVITFVLCGVPATMFGFAVTVGPIAVVTFFLVAVLVFGTELERWADHATPIAGLRGFRLHRTPVFFLLLAWFLLASVVDGRGHHTVRRAEVDAPPSLTVAEALASWSQANCTAEPGREDPANLVIVAASGGGIRAAYWTEGVLRSLFPDQTGCDRPVFAASGVSGGSLGIMSWLSKPEEKAEQVFDQDHLSATVAWLLHVDLPRSFLGFGGLDRAAVLEMSWEREQRALEQPFYAHWAPGAEWMPLALLNGTSVESGCRTLVAPLALSGYDRSGNPMACKGRPDDPPIAGSSSADAPALIDLGQHYLRCGDVNGSTAALLSARFPYITPAGRLTSCGNDEEHHVHVVDGGYVEASASLTAHDLYLTLRPFIECHNAAVAGASPGEGCPVLSQRPTRRIVPTMLQIDNGYDSVATPEAGDRPRELLVPLEGVRATAGIGDSAARQRTYDAFGCESYVRIANVPSPGVQAPLGWTLSKDAQADLDDQLKAVLKGRATFEEQVRHARERCTASR
ncbi:hypothetical protein AB0K14_25595 [Actinosynnema sp. NPDC050801]|uniref:hypothetical protein n=1 Tax=Actinosynnema sp. NPDC050801 TaxID=3155663 RepID=UPI00343AD8DD